MGRRHSKPRGTTQLRFNMKPRLKITVNPVRPTAISASSSGANFYPFFTGALSACDAPSLDKELQVYSSPSLPLSIRHY